MIFLIILLQNLRLFLYWDIDFYRYDFNQSKGIDRSLWGSNYDLPVSQLDLFATFADMIQYPLPGREQCTYAFDAESRAIPNDVKTRLMSEVKREGLFA